MSSVAEKKRRAAQAALSYLPDQEILGIGTGTTIDIFIEKLAPVAQRIKGAVPSSEQTRKALIAAGIPVIPFEEADSIPVYIDSADEANHYLHLIKGGGGALTQEKVLAGASKKFVCIINEEKLVRRLGQHPVPIEVLPMARSYIARHITHLGGRPIWRENFITDNGNPILDVYDLSLDEPVSMEKRINDISGVVGVGIFALRRADVLLVGKDDQVDVLT